MPYIKPELRLPLEFINPLPSNAGELNYAISHLVHRYVESKKGLSYANANEAMGVLACVQAEFYRTVVAPYENLKALENGPVSVLDEPFFSEASPVSHEPTAPSVDVTALAAALVSALGKPLDGPILPPKRAKRKPTVPESVQNPVIAPAPTPVEGEVDALKPGESKVLTGPIPGDTPGKEVVLQRTTGPLPPKGPVLPAPGKNASPGERALHALAEGDEF